MPLPECESFNTSFVQVVESFKCLYDPKLPEYSSRKEQDKAWNQIAEQFSSTGTECRLRWKNLRGGLTRYIKNLKGDDGRDGKSVKQFYMWEAMQFVIPFVKSRITPGEESTPYPPSYCFKHEQEDTGDMVEGSNSIADITDNQIDNHTHKQIDNLSELSETSEVGESLVYTSEVQTNSFPKGRKRLKVNEGVLENVLSNYIAKKTTERPENPDLNFFRSIIPDMAELNASQKRRFKQRVLQALEEISSEDT